MDSSDIKRFEKPAYIREDPELAELESHVSMISRSTNRISESVCSDLNRSRTRNKTLSSLREELGSTAAAAGELRNTKHAKIIRLSMFLIFILALLHHFLTRGKARTQDISAITYTIIFYLGVQNNIAAHFNYI